MKISGGVSLDELPGIRKGAWYRDEEDANGIAKVNSIMEYENHKYHYVRMVPMRPDYFRSEYVAEIDWHE